MKPIDYAPENYCYECGSPIDELRWFCDKECATRYNSRCIKWKITFELGRQTKLRKEKGLSVCTLWKNRGDYEKN